MKANEKRLRELAVRLFDINVVKFGNFEAKKGLTTPIYFDLRVIVSYPDVLITMSSIVQEMCEDQRQYDAVCGVPYTAIPLATVLSINIGTPMLLLRKEPKTYGIKKILEGNIVPGQECLIIDDVLTSGGSIWRTVNELKSQGLIVNDALVVLDRMQGGYKNLKRRNVNVKSIFTLPGFLQIIADEGKISKEYVDSILNHISDTQFDELVYSVN